MATVEFSIPKIQFLGVSTEKFNTCEVQYLRKLISTVQSSNEEI